MATLGPGFRIELQFVAVIDYNSLPRILVLRSRNILFPVKFSIVQKLHFGTIPSATIGNPRLCDYVFKKQLYVSWCVWFPISGRKYIQPINFSHRTWLCIRQRTTSSALIHTASALTALTWAQVVTSQVHWCRIQHTSPLVVASWAAETYKLRDFVTDYTSHRTVLSPMGGSCSVQRRKDSMTNSNHLSVTTY